MKEIIYTVIDLASGKKLGCVVAIDMETAKVRAEKLFGKCSMFLCASEDQTCLK